MRNYRAARTESVHLTRLVDNSQEDVCSSNRHNLQYMHRGNVTPSTYRCTHTHISLCAQFIQDMLVRHNEGHPACKEILTPTISEGFTARLL